MSISQYILPEPSTEYQEQLNNVIDSFMRDVREELNSDTRYFGDPQTDGSWRIKKSGDDFIFQKKVSGSWDTKNTISGI